MHSVEPPLVRRYRGDRLHLGLRSLYIVPTRFGLLWLLATALLHLVAIQQRSNGTLLLSFLLLGLMLLAMHLTHDNLHGLELRCARPDPGFAAQAVTYPLRLHSRGPRQRLRLQFAGGEPLELETLPGGETAVDLGWSPQHRGLHRPGRLHIETIAPLGLFVCWGRWEPSQDQLILPARRPGPVAEQDPPSRQDGLEEWQDLKPHRTGERLALVDWPSLAKGRPLQTKQFSDPAERHHLLRPAPGVEREQALEHLADRIWRLHQRGETYGLQLAGQTLEPQRGLQHRDACLMALALA